METITVRGRTGSSRIIVDESLENLGRYLDPSRTIVITDHEVNRLYRDLFAEFDVIEIGRGENVKTLQTVEEICRQLVEREADRTSFIAGIGGGIVCDIAGFAASVYMRGLKFAFAPTTLLAQVDAAIGGKNGVNLGGYKNMIGVFQQPQFVICDPRLLKTLPAEEVACGMAEIIKHAAIGSRELFAFLENSVPEINVGNQTILAKIICDSLRIKAAVVGRDERERGERKKLNFGHSLGHALEKISGIPHGQAISIGMVAAARISVKRGLLPSTEAERIVNLLRQMKLSVDFPFQREIVYEAMKKDKKRKSDKIDYVLLDSIGHAVIAEIPIAELGEVIDDMR
jgi:3-dehydroquinate synthase